MAPPLNFKPKPLEIHSALQSELEHAPREHADALLNLYALLREAQDHGWLDAARGAIAGAPVAITEISKYANSEQSINMIRNLVSLGRILGSIDPEVLHRISAAVEGSRDQKSTIRSFQPTLPKVLGSLFNRDVLRAAAFTLGVLAVLGKALGRRD